MTETRLNLARPAWASGRSVEGWMFWKGLALGAVAGVILTVFAIANLSFVLPPDQPAYCVMP